MHRGYTKVLLFLTLGSLANPLTSFADQKTTQSTVGITFFTSEEVPTPNQIVPSQKATPQTRGDPMSVRKLPQTNSTHNPLLTKAGISLIIMSEIILIIKKKKRKKQ